MTNPKTITRADFENLLMSDILTLRMDYVTEDIDFPISAHVMQSRILSGDFCEDSYTYIKDETPNRQFDCEARAILPNGNYLRVTIRFKHLPQLERHLA